MAVEVAASQQARLVLLEAFDPGWLAWVDGVPARVERANLLFRALEVPAGKPREELRYRPWTASAGAALSLGGVLGALALSARGWRARRLIGPRPEGSIQAT